MFAAYPSRRKRSRRPWSADNLGSSIFTASSARFRWVARYTTAIPPIPRIASNRYFPRTTVPSRARVRFSVFSMVLTPSPITSSRHLALTQYPILARSSRGYKSTCSTSSAVADSPKKRAATSAKLLGRSVTRSVDAAGRGARAREPALAKKRARVLRGRRARCRRLATCGAEHRARLVLDLRAEQRVVRAAEDDDVDPRARERLEVTARGEARDLALRPALFRERNEERRGLAVRSRCASSTPRPRADRRPTRWFRRSRARRPCRSSSRAAAARAPGSITPSTGRSSSTRRRSGATALTVLHAMTIAFTPRATRWFAHASA